MGKLGKGKYKESKTTIKSVGGRPRGSKDIKPRKKRVVRKKKT